MQKIILRLKGATKCTIEDDDDSSSDSEDEKNESTTVAKEHIKGACVTIQIRQW